MANNRIYIQCVCDGDDSALFLAKRYTDGYYGPPVEMSEWFDRHKLCGGTMDHFSIAYECTPDYEVGGIEAMLREKLDD